MNRNLKISFLTLIMLSVQGIKSFSQISISASVTSLCSSLAGSGNYSVPAIANATYNWTMPLGMIISSGQGSNAIVGSWSTTAIHNGIIGDVCVTIDSAGVIYNACVAIDLNDAAPVTPSSIVGPAKMCPGDTFMYSVGIVSNASSYNWNAPFGSVVISANGNDTVIIAATSSFTAAGNVAVAAVNSCGVSAYRTRTVSPNILPAISSISGRSDGVCKMDSVVYSCPPIVGAQSYNWVVAGNGATIIGLNTDTTLTVNFDSTVTTVTIQVNAVNDCGNGAVRVLTVTGRPATPGPITGPTSACTNQNCVYTVSTVNGATNYTWTVPGGATVISGQGTKIMTVKYGPVPANNLTVAVKTSNDCGTAATRTLNGISLISCPTSNQETEVSTVNLFPNPANDYLTIDFIRTVEKKYLITMYDLSGKIISQKIKSAINNQIIIDVKILNAGFYLIAIHSAEDFIQNVQCFCC